MTLQHKFILFLTLDSVIHSIDMGYLPSVNTVLNIVWGDKGGGNIISTGACWQEQEYVI